MPVPNCDYTDWTDYSCSSQQCLNSNYPQSLCGCVTPDLKRDCNCDCQYPETPAFAYITDSCGCNIGNSNSGTAGVCPKVCDGFPENYYCTQPIFECPAVPGCTDPNAQNFDESATIDDGACTYPDDFMEKPNINKRWLFEDTEEPTDLGEDPGWSITGAPFDISNLYYFNLKLDGSIVNTDYYTVYAYVSDQVRGIARISQTYTGDDYYFFIEVKWKEELEKLNEIQFSVVSDDYQEYTINYIEDYMGEEVEPITSTTIYS